MRSFFLLFATFSLLTTCLYSAGWHGGPDKNGLRLVKKLSPIPWLVSEDKAHNIVIKVGEDKQITISPATSLFVRKYDSKPHEWEEYSFEWKKKRMLSLSRSLLLTKKVDGKELWYDILWFGPIELALAFKKGTATFNGIEKLLAVHGCNGVPQSDPKTSVYFYAFNALIVQGYEAPKDSVRRREDIRYFNAEGSFGIRCDSDPNLWAMYWWIKPTKAERKKGYCGSFVLDNYKNTASTTDVGKILASAPPALPYLTCQQLEFLAANKQFKYPSGLDGHVYVGKGAPAAAKYAYGNEDEEYYDEDEEYYDEDEEYYDE
eukprot:190238_1